MLFYCIFSVSILYWNNFLGKDAIRIYFSVVLVMMLRQIFWDKDATGFYSPGFCCFLAFAMLVHYHVMNGKTNRELALCG